MKILYVDQTGKLGGGEIALLPLLQHRPQDARMILLEDGPFRALVEAAGIPVEVLALDSVKAVRRESGVGSVLAAIPAFFRLCRSMRVRTRQADVVYANSQKAFLLAAFSRQKGQPLVWHLRDIITAEHFSPLMRRVAVFFGNRCASAILVNSEATAEAFCAAGGDRNLVTVVYDGVAPEPFDRIEEEDPAAALRVALAVEGKPLVGLFGRLTEWKGQHVLLEAAASLPEVQVVLVGDALFGEDAYVERLKLRAAKPDLAGRVHFLGFQQDVPRLMRAMDVIVHCSTAPEPFGLVIVEGMLARRPVIASAAGGALEIMTGESGLLVAPGDATALRSAITRLLENPELARRLAEEGRARAESAFSIKRLIDGIDAVLSGLRRQRP